MEEKDRIINELSHQLHAITKPKHQKKQPIQNLSNQSRLDGHTIASLEFSGIEGSNDWEYDMRDMWTQLSTQFETLGLADSFANSSLKENRPQIRKKTQLSKHS